MSIFVLFGLVVVYGKEGIRLPDGKYSNLPYKSIEIRTRFFFSLFFLEKQQGERGDVLHSARDGTWNVERGRSLSALPT